MNYKGKLYGRYAGEYFDTGLTSEDWDKLESENKAFKLLERLRNAQKTFFPDCECTPDMQVFGCIAGDNCIHNKH